MHWRLQLTIRAISEVKLKSEGVKSVISGILNKNRAIEGQVCLNLIKLI